MRFSVDVMSSTSKKSSCRVSHSVDLLVPFGVMVHLLLCQFIYVTSCCSYGYRVPTVMVALIVGGFELNKFLKWSFIPFSFGQLGGYH